MKNEAELLNILKGLKTCMVWIYQTSRINSLNDGLYPEYPEYLERFCDKYPVSFVLLSDPCEQLVHLFLFKDEERNDGRGFQKTSHLHSANYFYQVEVISKTIDSEKKAPMYKKEYDQYFLAAGFVGLDPVRHTQITASGQSDSILGQKIKQQESGTYTPGNHKPGPFARMIEDAYEFALSNISLFSKEKMWVEYQIPTF